MMAPDDYSFLFEPPKESDVFTKVRYFPRSPRSPDPGAATQTSPSTPPSLTTAAPALLPPAVPLGDNRHAATLSKFTTGLLSSNSAASETVAPFLTEHIPAQVHIPENRAKTHSDEHADRVYCYRHQPDLRCTRRTPQEDTVAEIQQVPHPQRPHNFLGIPF